MAIDNLKPLSVESQQRLLGIARKTIEAHLNHEVRPTFQISDTELLVKRGVFVSLHRGEELRGCVGYITSQNPLYQTVAAAVGGATTKDPRFEPVQAKELPGIAIEISVLTALERLQKVDDIEIGVHGLYVTQGRQSGLLLPQVPTSYGWDRSEFLQQTCRKAGLPDDAWKKPETEIYLFSAQVLAE